jgi:hypothetical protein
VARYLTDLADVCRATGLQVWEQEGWQSRARSSGGYSDGRPDHVMVHHTASGPSADGWPDADYCSFTSDIRPVANLYLDRSGAVYVLAAGACNTNGSGCDPCGITADDDMNVHAIGIEAGNDGVGEPWPDAQQNAYVRLVDALCSAYLINPLCCHSHAEYAPTRKIDPAGPSRWAPEGGTWPMDAFRYDLGTQVPQPAPGPVGDDEMVFTTTKTGDAVYAQGSEMSVRHVTNNEGWIAEALTPGWAAGAPVLDPPDDVAAWLSTL